MLTMPDAWITLPLPATVWLVSAIITIATLEIDFFGFIGAVAWLVFLSGIIAFFMAILGN